ncbi:hypothetical protein ACWEN3_45805 [Streptomyces sp. NPDC004561]
MMRSTNAPVKRAHRAPPLLAPVKDSLDEALRLHPSAGHPGS